jgi:hypothetical protein
MMMTFLGKAAHWLAVMACLSLGNAIAVAQVLGTLGFP